MMKQMKKRLPDPVDIGLPPPARLTALAYPILRGRLLNCQFVASDLRREAGLA